MVSLQDIVTHLDTELQTSIIRDARNALNGLQVENNGQVSKVALAVDASQKTIDAAIAAGADLLIVHHGLFWSGLLPMTGWWKKKITSCLDHNLAVYSAHLPLDLHPTLGNNASIVQGLGLTDIQPEVDMGGQSIGFAGHFDGTISELKTRFEALLDSPVTGYVHDANMPAGRVAVCSGSAGDEIYKMQAKGYQTYITGEENHWVVNAAEDMGVNMLFGGHYATETFGVKALGELLEQKFGLPCSFIHHPTDM